MRRGLQATVFKIKGNHIVKAWAKMTKKKEREKKNLLRSKIQPNLKKEAGDQGSRGFTWGLPRGRGRGCPQPGLRRAGSSGLRGPSFMSPPTRVARLRTPMKFSNLKLISGSLNSENLESFQGTENGRWCQGPVFLCITGYTCPRGRGTMWILHRRTKGWPVGTPSGSGPLACS